MGALPEDGQFTMALYYKLFAIYSDYERWDKGCMNKGGICKGQMDVDGKSGHRARYPSLYEQFMQESGYSSL